MTVNELSRSSIENWSNIHTRLESIDGAVYGQTGTKGLLGKVDVLSTTIAQVKDSVGQVEKTVNQLSKSSGNGSKTPLDDPQKEASEVEFTKEDVKAVQNKLQKLNLYDDIVDGRMGPRTTSAIKKWQTEMGPAYGITKTGPLDLQTFEAMVGRKPGAASNAESGQDEAGP